MNRATLEKWILIGIILFAIFALNIYYLFSPSFAKTKTSRTEYKKNVATINDLLEKASRKEEFDANKKFYKYQLVSLSQELPTIIAPEKYILVLKDIAVRNGIILEKFTFTNPEVYAQENVKTSYDPASELSKKADNMIKTMFLKDSDGKEDINILQVSNITDESPIKVAIRANLIGNFEQIRNAVKEIEALDNRNVISEITFQDKKEGNSSPGTKLEGRITITLYGFKDSKIPVHDLWTQEFGRGRGDIFKTASGPAVPLNTGTDFSIALNAADSDVPSVVLGKNGIVDSRIYANNRSVEELELYIEEKDGVFLCKYKTLSNKQAYPAGYSKPVEFVPGNPNEITVDVYSALRKAENDMAGVNLTIVKKTEKNINVRVYNDDPARPRITTLWQ